MSFITKRKVAIVKVVGNVFNKNILNLIKKKIKVLDIKYNKEYDVYYILFTHKSLEYCDLSEIEEYVVLFERKIIKVPKILVWLKICKFNIVERAKIDEIKKINKVIDYKDFMKFEQIEGLK